MGFFAGTGKRAQEEQLLLLLANKLSLQPLIFFFLFFFFFVSFVGLKTLQIFHIKTNLDSIHLGDF